MDKAIKDFYLDFLTIAKEIRIGKGGIVQFKHRNGIWYKDLLPHSICEFFRAGKAKIINRE